MSYENNHYVPQLILRRYGNKINRYNVITHDYKIAGIKNSFSKKNLYPEDVEKRLSLLESQFANILDKKILNAKSKVIINRIEVDLIKKFLIILQMRTPDTIKYMEYRNVACTISEFKEIVIENETDEDYWLRTLNVILDLDRLMDVTKHPNVTYEACKWVYLYNYCYLTIWDSKNSGEDFVITDEGMTCEHEASRFMFSKYQEEFQKNGYLHKHLDETKDKDKQMTYYRMMNMTSFVHANFYIFSISSTRMIGLINPFFRLYYDKDLLCLFGGEPDIWPSHMSKDALKLNNTNYKHKNPINDFTD